MIPRLAVVDPELAVSLPPRQTAATGMDALTQLMEAFVSHAASPLTDPQPGRNGPRRTIPAPGRDRRRDLAVRSDMAPASLFSGMALANAKLGAVHGLAASSGRHARGGPRRNLRGAASPRHGGQHRGPALSLPDPP